MERAASSSGLAAGSDWFIRLGSHFFSLLFPLLRALLHQSSALLPIFGVGSDLWNGAPSAPVNANGNYPALEREQGILHHRCNINMKFHHLGFKKNKLWLDLNRGGEEEYGREPCMSIENICS